MSANVRDPLLHITFGYTHDGAVSLDGQVKPHLTERDKRALRDFSNAVGQFVMALAGDDVLPSGAIPMVRGNGQGYEREFIMPMNNRMIVKARG